MGAGDVPSSIRPSGPMGNAASELANGGEDDEAAASTTVASSISAEEGDEERAMQTMAGTL